MTHLYDMSDEDIISLWKKSPYNPISQNKAERKIKSFTDFLNEQGIGFEKWNLQPYQERGFFGTEYRLRIYNPNCNKDDDEVCRSVLLFTL